MDSYQFTKDLLQRRFPQPKPEFRTFRYVMKIINKQRSDIMCNSRGLYNEYTLLINPAALKSFVKILSIEGGKNLLEYILTDGDKYLSIKEVLTDKKVRSFKLIPIM